MSSAKFSIRKFFQIFGKMVKNETFCQKDEYWIDGLDSEEVNNGDSEEHFEGSEDSDDDAPRIADLLGLEVNSQTTKLVKILFWLPTWVQRGNFGAVNVPEKQDENLNNDLDVETVIDLFHMREEALEAGRKACMQAHNEYRIKHKVTRGAVRASAPWPALIIN